MTVQAEVSLYALRTARLSEPIDRFCQALARRGLEVEGGAMSTQVAGETGQVFAALGEAYAQVAEDYETVLVIKVSNACPGVAEA